MALPETFTQFARTAAEQLRWKKARPLVEDELLTHLCDQRDALMAGGMDETVATAESLRLTGDPYEIGTELDRVHRPKTPAALFMLAAAIALSGLAFIVLVSFAADMGDEYQDAAATVDVFAQAVQTANNGDTVMTAQGWPNL